MTGTASPRASLAAREAVRKHLAAQDRGKAVQISRVLSDLRARQPGLHEDDEELIRLIVEDATDHGLAVHFDRSIGM